MIEVTSVEVIDQACYRLRVGFADGFLREIDLPERLRDGGPVFRPLYDNPVGWRACSAIAGTSSTGGSARAGSISARLIGQMTLSGR